MGVLRELADLTGLSAHVTAALADTYKGRWVYAPGAVFADLAVAVADGADCIDGVGQLCADREHVFGAAGRSAHRCHAPTAGARCTCSCACGGVGRGSRPGPGWVAAHRHRCHAGYRSLR